MQKYTRIIYINRVADYSLQHWSEEKIHPLSFCFQWSVFCIDFERTRIKLKWNPSVSDTVVGGLLGHEAHGVVTTGLGELPHLGPLVCIGVIVQHVSKCVPFALNPLLAACNDASWNAIERWILKIIVTCDHKVAIRKWHSTDTKSAGWQAWCHLPRRSSFLL